MLLTRSGMRFRHCSSLISLRIAKIVTNLSHKSDRKRFQTVFSPKNRIVRPTKIVTFWPTKGNHLCVTPNDCRRQTLVFKQVKTLASPNSTAHPKRLIWIHHCVVINNTHYSTGRQKQPSLCILDIGVGAGKFLAGCNIGNSLHETNGKYENLKSMKSQLHCYHTQHISLQLQLHS